MYFMLADKGWQGHMGEYVAGRGDRSIGQADRAAVLVLSFQHSKGDHNAIRGLL